MSTLTKRIVIVASALGLVGLTAWGSYALSSYITSKKQPQVNQNTTQKDVEKPDKLLEAYEAFVPSIGSGVAKDTLSTLGSSMAYTPASPASFTLSVPAAYRLGISSDQVSLAAQAIRQKTDSFLLGKGLVQDTSIRDSSRVHYVSKNVVCDLHTATVEKKVYGAFACALTSSLTAEYTAIKKLIDISKDSQITATNPTITSTTLTKDSTKLKILSYRTDKHQINAYFATLDDNWEYLGKKQIAGVEGAQMESTTEFDATIQKNIPKYGDILKPLLDKK